MNYSDVRAQIRTGDLIAFRTRRGMLARLTRWVTKSPYTHTALVIWVGLGADDPHAQPAASLPPEGGAAGLGWPGAGRDARRLLVAEQKASGAFLTPLSQYAGDDFDVFDAPHEVLLDVGDTIWKTLGQPIHYDVVDLLRIAANRLLGWPLPKRDDTSLVCSALSATIWLQSGWQPRWPLPSIPAPDDVVSALGVPPVLQFRPVDPWGGRND